MKPSSIRDLAASFGRSLRLVWRSAPRLAAAHAVLATVQALLPLAALYALKRAVDAAAAAVHALPAAGGWQVWLHDPSARAVAGWFVAGAAVMGAGALLGVAASWLSELHAMAVSDHVHGLLHGKLAEVDLAFFEDSAEQDRLHLAQEQAMTRPIGVLGSLFQFLEGAVGFGGVLVLLAALHPLVAVVLAGAGVPALLLRLHRSRRLYEWRRGLAPHEREAGYYHHLLVSGDYAKEMRLHGHGGFCRGRFESVRRRLRASRLAWRRYVLTREFSLQLFALAVAAALLLWMTGRLLAGSLTLGALVMYAQAVQRGQSQLGMVVASVVEIHQSALFLQAFDGLLRLQPRVTAPAAPRALPAAPRAGIVFERVSFAYPGTDRAVLHDLSFALRPGERLALVGANGAGKSTIVKLLCRLYDPTAGRILAEGVDLRELDPAAWRRRIGVLFQDFGRYQLTAAENIWIGDPRGRPDDPRVAEAARRADIDGVAATWPQGLATPLGRWLHPGIEPSAGQWQRLALARALVRNADLVIMDEPSSALDARAQRDVVRLLRDAAAGRMALVVSHRPEMLDLADRVLVLAGGTVTEEGTPVELRARHGEFAGLFCA
jgi:ATP-binding cassette subfamily B protein